MDLALYHGFVAVDLEEFEECDALYRYYQIHPENSNAPISIITAEERIRLQTDLQST